MGKAETEGTRPQVAAGASDGWLEFGDAISRIHDLFVTGNALSILLFDLDVLAELEHDQGHDARVATQRAFEALLGEVASERLASCDLLVRTEPGRHELAIVLLREHRDARFYRQELPGFDDVARRRIEREGAKRFYPYLRTPPEIVSGYAVGLRNPRYGVDTQLQRILDEARADAALNRKIAARKRRRRFHELVLDRRITSVYEPIVEVQGHVVFGYEALARGPEGTEFQMPLVLFDRAREEDLVFELDCLCRGSALAGAIGFPEGTKLFINVLPSAIHDPNFRAERLIQTLDECRLAPSDCVLEVSEQQSIADFAAFKEMRDEYRKLGFQFALDDVGSGYAGLEALLEISPEFLKIDRAFVSGVDEDPQRQDVLRLLRGVADKTGARIIGEGLDTLEELEMLGELGIDFGQGWLFGHPTPLRARDESDTLELEESDLDDESDLEV